MLLKKRNAEPGLVAHWWAPGLGRQRWTDCWKFQDDWSFIVRSNQARLHAKPCGGGGGGWGGRKGRWRRKDLKRGKERRNERGNSQSAGGGGLQSWEAEAEGPRVWDRLSAGLRKEILSLKRGRGLHVVNKGRLIFFNEQRIRNCAFINLGKMKSG